MSASRRSQPLFTKRIVGPSISLRQSAFGDIPVPARSPKRMSSDVLPQSVDTSTEEEYNPKKSASSPVTCTSSPSSNAGLSPVVRKAALPEERFVAFRRSDSYTSSMDKNAPATTSCSEGVSTPMHCMRVSLAMKALIGQGSFGKVYQAMDRETNRIIAVKEIALNIVGGSKESLDTVRRELAVLKQLDHPNITKYLGEEVEEDFLRIYMEYIPCGSISALLRTFGPLQENQVTIYIRQVLQGLEYLHGKCIIHRDLKGDNLLVNADGSLKLADFGTAKDMREAGTLRKVNGTANFMSPEAVEGKTVDEKTDVWSVGCCAVEMLTGTPPLAGVPSQYAIMMQIAEAKEDTLSMYLPSHAEFSKHAKDFVRQCLQRDPAKRPSAAELRAHPWLTKDPAWGSSRVASSSGPTPCNTTDTSATPTGENMVQKEHRSKSKRRSDSKKGSTSKKRSTDTAEDDKSSKKKRSGKKSKSRRSKSKSPTPSALNTLDLTLLPGDNSGDDDLPGRAITPA